MYYFPLYFRFFFTIVLCLLVMTRIKNLSGDHGCGSGVGRVDDDHEDGNGAVVTK